MSLQRRLPVHRDVRRRQIIRGNLQEFTVREPDGWRAQGRAAKQDEHRRKEGKPTQGAEQRDAREGASHQGLSKIRRAKKQAAPVVTQSDGEHNTIARRSRQGQRRRKATQKKTASREGAGSASVRAEQRKRRQHTAGASRNEADHKKRREKEHQRL